MEPWRVARLVIAKSIIMKRNWIRFLIKVKCRIRISTKVIRIRNSGGFPGSFGLDTDFYIRI
jgi:hypothetical protein